MKQGERVPGVSVSWSPTHPLPQAGFWCPWGGLGLRGAPLGTSGQNPGPMSR